MNKGKNHKIKVPRFDSKFGFKTDKKRSELMAKIRSKDTKPEVTFRKQLWRMGIRYRTNVQNLPGCPDIVIKKQNLIIFIDGEFWHGYKWAEKKNRIKANRNFWIPKIERNIQRDKETNKKLKKLGYKVIRFWQKQIYNDPEKCLKKILRLLKN